jgi:glycerol-3-phosphate dehydrogenase (NAD(P)+)
MSTIAIVGAGMMGTAICWPLRDNNHHVRLVGTQLDEEIITSIRHNGYHPTLKRRIPKDLELFNHTQLGDALDRVDLIVSGVSSFGVHWFSESVGPHLHRGVPVIAVTKGLEDQHNGDLLIIPDAIDKYLPVHLRGRISLNAIAGPCIAHELAARRQTCVVFCGKDTTVLHNLRQLFITAYYHIWISTDTIGVEVCAAMKNAYALGVGIAVGMMEQAGQDGLAHMYNPQAALFAQGSLEMARLVEVMGGNLVNLTWLPAPGDLYVTVFGGRTVQLGKLLGKGVPFHEAQERMAGITLESVEIITRVSRALRKMAEQQIVSLADFPLLLHLDRILNEDEPVNFPWQHFFSPEDAAIKLI